MTNNMKDKFPGYFRPSDDEFEGLWRDALIVPDANILLHFLRYGESTRNEVMNILKSFDARLWIPHQVAWEFLRGWRAVDAENRIAYDKIIGEVRKNGDSLSKIFNRVSRHQIIDAEEEKKKIESFIEDVCSSLKAAEARHPDVSESEAIVDQIADLFDGRVGKEPSGEEIEIWKKSAEGRFAKKVPPGYMDVEKEGDERFGDLYIWMELIEKSKESNSSIIFVSDDRKEDWVYRISGKDIGPRPELVSEFAKETGNRFYSYSFRIFIDRAKQYLNANVSDETIAEIVDEEKAREEAENNRVYLESEIRNWQNSHLGWYLENRPNFGLHHFHVGDRNFYSKDIPSDIISLSERIKLSDFYRPKGIYSNEYENIRNEFIKNVKFLQDLDNMDPVSRNKNQEIRRALVSTLNAQRDALLFFEGLEKERKDPDIDGDDDD